MHGSWSEHSLERKGGVGAKEGRVWIMYAKGVSMQIGPGCYICRLQLFHTRSAPGIKLATARNCQSEPEAGHLGLTSSHSHCHPGHTELAISVWLSLSDVSPFPQLPNFSHELYNLHGYYNMLSSLYVRIFLSLLNFIQKN